MSERFLNYGRQSVQDDDLDAVISALKSDFLTQGPIVEAFERDLAAKVGARYAVAVSSGTAALHVACLAAGITSGKRGLSSTLTFIASVNAYLYCGATAKALDITRNGLGLNVDALKMALEADGDIAAVTPVHYAGLACDAPAIRLAAKNSVIIEDASHALGGLYEDGAPVGSCKYADMTVFSFHPVKPITTAEGGAILTNDEHLYRQLKMFSNHGIERRAECFQNADVAWEGDTLNPWYYEQHLLGLNYRMSDIHAALGRAQLSKLDRFIARRREIALRYDKEFAGIAEIDRRQSNPEDRQRSAHHLYPVAIDFVALGTTRMHFMDRLKSLGIGGQIHYIPIHRQPYQVERFGYVASDFPMAEQYFHHCLSLPLHADMSDAEVDRVINAVRATVELCDAA